LVILKRKSRVKGNKGEPSPEREGNGRSAWYIPPCAIISYECPHHSWVRSTIHPASDYRWPIPDLLSVLADLGAKQQEQSIDDLRIATHDRAQGLTVEEVWMIYHLLLKREPNAKAFHKYVAARRRRTMTSAAFIEEILASREFGIVRSFHTAIEVG
jgi:hypothetical protein